MPELPDIAVYLEALESRVIGQRLERVVLKNPFLLRTAEPALAECEGRLVSSLRRLGKRIAIGLESDLWLVIHLMIAGRLHWYDAAHDAGRSSASLRPRHSHIRVQQIRPALLHLEFANGVLTLTEAGTKRRASLHVVHGADLDSCDRGGLEVLDAGLEDFRAALTRTNHTLKRALTDPTILSGVGNAYSDEILHAARLSPLMQTKQLDDEEWRRLFEATRATLIEWTRRLRAESADRFPEKITAFRKDMAVHGRYGEPCPTCGTAIQRIRYAENETNYCPRCQTGGKLLADRSLSRLLKSDWPKTIDELENQRKN
ncbi:MAG: Fpg/Nei family DNA glycosylase [Steroidobacter sp.]